MSDNKRERIKITGGCACGDVRYGFYGPTSFQGACHCRSCQYSSGGGPAYLVGVPREQFRVTKGRVAEYVTLSESGRLATRSFCGRCGTHLYTSSDSAPDLCSIKVGTLDDPSRFKPRVRLFTREAQPWHKKYIFALRFRKNLPFPKLRKGATLPEPTGTTVGD